MTPRAKRLRGAVAAAVGPGKVDAVLRAVVGELGVTREDVVDAEWAATCATVNNKPTTADRLKSLASPLSTLLEASGER